VNGDGAVDIFENNLSCCGRSQAPADILLNDGAGRFTAATDRLRGFPLNQYGKTYSLACAFADVNGDTRPDLVIGGDEQVERSAVLLNDGRGFFDFFGSLPPKLYAAQTGIVIDIKSADVNGDGFADLLMAETQNDPYYIGAKIQVLVNDGHGRFSDETSTRLPQQPSARSWPNRLLLEDLDDDGTADLTVQYAPIGIVPAQDATPSWLNRRGVFTSIAPPRSGSPPNLGGMVGFVNGTGPHALFSVDTAGGDATTAYYYVAAQIVPPAAPTRVRAVRLTRGVRVSWRPVADATRYEVWRSGHRIGTLTGKALVDVKAPRSATTYTVRALNAAGFGPFSTPARVAGRH
jgi:hypothetical protein